MSSGTDALVETSSGLLIEDGRLLLGLRAAWKRVAPDRWDAIGGHVEAGETAEAALVRELREEVGVTATEYRLIASLPEPRPDLYGEALHHIFAVTRWDGGQPWNACNEHAEIRWFDAAMLAALRDTTDFNFPALFALAQAG